MHVKLDLGGGEGEPPPLPQGAARDRCKYKYSGRGSAPPMPRLADQGCLASSRLPDFFQGGRGGKNTGVRR